MSKVVGSDELMPDDGEQFNVAILTVDTESGQISMEWPEGRQPRYVQMPSDLFTEWVEMMNAQRRLIDILLHHTPEQAEEMSALKEMLRIP